MRKIETEVRRQKDIANLAKASGDDVLRREAQAKILDIRKKYSEVADKSGLRERPERMVVESYKKAGVTTSESGITSKQVPKEQDFRINKGLIDSNEYKRKFNNITGNTTVDAALHKYAKASLYHRDGTNREDLYIISSKTGNILGRNTDSTEAFGVEPNKDVINAVKNYQGELIGLHSHPDGSPPTGSDFATAFNRRYEFGLVANATGNVYIYGNGKRFISASFIDSTIEKYVKMVDIDGNKVYTNRIDAHLAALKQLRKDYGIWYEAR